MVHSDSGFAAVSYLRVKGATLKDKPESGNDLTIPPLLEADFVRIQTLLHGYRSADSSIHVVSKTLTRRSTIQAHGSSNSRRGDWVAVGNIYHATGEDITFEEEVLQCFCDLQGNSTSVE